MVKYPDDWKVVRLGDLCSKIGSGATPTGGSSSYCEVGVSLIRSQNVLDNYFSECGLARINDDQADGLSNVVVESHDVLLNITGDSVARVCVVSDAVLPARVNQHVCILRTKSCECDYNYVCYTLVHDKERLLTIASAGATRNALTKKNVEQFELVVPPLPEQKRIAAVLGNVDKLIDNLSRRIEKKRLVKQGVMQDLLTGKKRLPGFKGEWVEKRLGEIAELQTATISSTVVDLSWYVGTENMLPERGGIVKNVASVTYDTVREYREGDILVSNIRPYLKKIWLSDRRGGCSTDVLVVRGGGDFVTPAYLYCVLSRDCFFDYVMENAVGTKMPRGDKKIIVAYNFFLPPFAEQKAIAKVLGDMDAEIAKLEAKREKYREIKRGLMSDLLTGKVRVGVGALAGGAAGALAGGAAGALAGGAAASALAGGAASALAGGAAARSTLTGAAARSTLTGAAARSTLAGAAARSTLTEKEA